MGSALAAAFAREGALLAISAHNAERGKARAKTLRAQGARVIAFPTDLTTGEGAQALVEAALFLVTKAGDGVNGIVLPVQGKGI